MTRGDDTVIDYLNRALTNELTAVNQYWLHYRLFDHWGITRLAAYERKESIEEMEHADRITERILFLGGHPNFQRLGQLRIGESVEEVLASDLALEADAIPLLREAIAHCETVRDYVTRDLLLRILENEEEHVDFIEKQQELIERMGLANYVQLQTAPATEQPVVG